MKHKVIVVMSLVAAGVMIYPCSLGLDEDFYHFLGSYLQDFGMMSGLSEKVGIESQM